jgi:hypothetical protein
MGEMAALPVLHLVKERTEKTVFLIVSLLLVEVQEEVQDKQPIVETTVDLVEEQVVGQQ